MRTRLTVLALAVSMCGGITMAQELGAEGLEMYELWSCHGPVDRGQPPLARSDRARAAVRGTGD